MRILTILLLIIFVVVFATAAIASPAPEIPNEPGGMLERIEEAKKVDLPSSMDNLSAKAQRWTDRLWVNLRGYTVPFLVITFIVVAFLLILSPMLGKGLRALAGLIVITGLGGFILINYAPNIVGAILSILDSIASSFITH